MPAEGFDGLLIERLAEERFDPPRSDQAWDSSLLAGSFQLDRPAFGEVFSVTSDRGREATKGIARLPTVRAEAGTDRIRAV